MITRALRESEMKFRAVVSQSLVGIVIVEDDKFTYSNERFNEMFGYSEDEIRGLGPRDVSIEADHPVLDDALRQRTSGAADSVHYIFRGRRKDGELRDVEVYGNAIDVDGTRVLISVTMDVTQRISTERAVHTLQEELKDQSMHDALTGLYNRRFLDDYLQDKLSVAEKSGQRISVIMGDLDHFKAINDCLGHLAGDEVLRVLGQRMRDQARSGDVYCRYGGEEFLLVLPDISEERAVERAEQLRVAISATPIVYNDRPIETTASFGVASFPRDARSADELIAAADRSLYVAKAAGRNRVESAGVTV